MGAVCGKVLCDIDNGDGIRRSGRRNQGETSKYWQKHFTVDLECYSVPMDRVLTQDMNTLAGPRAECRSVVVTTIHVERNVATTPQNRLSALNSVIYTPVLQWFGIDVREQVPEYLPMNLWAGSYTVFGFYKPEEAGSTYVTLTAKIGTEQLFLEESLNTKKSLSAEQWSNITRCLEKELAKLPSRTSADHKTTGQKAVDEDMTQRSSQDTGYMSRKITPNQSPFSYKYTDLTSDSEDATVKEKQIKEKKLRLRRKDTPAANIHPFQFSVSFKDSMNRLMESPLAEEDAPDSPSISASNFPMRRSVSSYELDATTDVTVQDESNTNILSTPTALKVSKSYQDIPDILSPEPLNECSTQGPDFEISGLKSPSVPRKKKRSIASKLGAEMTSPVPKDSHDDRKEQHHHGDIGSDADDEESILTDSDKMTKRMPLSQSCNKGEEIATLSSKKVAEAEQSNSSEERDLELDQKNEPREDDQDNIAAMKVGEVRSECELIIKEEETKDTGEFKNEMQQETALPNVGISEQPTESVNIKVSINTKANEKVSDKNKTLTKITDSEVDKVKSIEKMEPKANSKIMKKTPVRTDSSAKLVRRSFSKPEKDKKTEDYKVNRANKSISYSSKAAYIEERKKQSREHEAYLETDSAPPTTPKEAFSDTN